MSGAHPVCAVVGIGPGLGAALARRFAAGGFAVLGLARNPAKAPHEPGVTLREADAADPASLAGALGAVDVLIYNAYCATMAIPSALDPAALEADFRVNVSGALAAAQAVLPDMLARGRGTILFTGGGLAFDPTGWLPAASLAVGKAGLRNLALSLHAELAPRGIHAGTVTVCGRIEPGTAFDPDRIADAFWAMHEAGPGTPAEVMFKGEAP